MFYRLESDPVTVWVAMISAGPAVTMSEVPSNVEIVQTVLRNMNCTTASSGRFMLSLNLAQFAMCSAGGVLLARATAEYRP